MFPRISCQDEVFCDALQLWSVHFEGVRSPVRKFGQVAQVTLGKFNTFGLAEERPVLKFLMAVVDTLQQIRIWLDARLLDSRRLGPSFLLLWHQPSNRTYNSCIIISLNGASITCPDYPKATSMRLEVDQPRAAEIIFQREAEWSWMKLQCFKALFRVLMKCGSWWIQIFIPHLYLYIYIYIFIYDIFARSCFLEEDGNPGKVRGWP